MARQLGNEELRALMLENRRLLQENNALLRKMHRNAMWALAFRVVWFAILVGVPIALYYFVLEPNLETFERSYSVIQEGTQDITGLRQFLESLEQSRTQK